jgi:splicing factor 3B subunit 3
MRHGLAVTEVAVTELPGNPNAVWAVRRNAAGKRHSLKLVFQL